MSSIGQLPKSLSRDAGKGALWIYGRVAAVQILNLATIVVLARQLELDAFGIVALANVALSFFSALASEGVNQFIIFDQKEDHQARARAAFWLNVVLGILTLSIGFLAAAPLARFFNEPQFQYIFQLMILRFPLEAITRTFDAISHKNLNFRNTEIRDTVLQLFSGISSIGMALSGYGVWSLVVPAVLVSTVQPLLAAMATRWRPGWDLGFRHWLRIIKYSGNIFGGSLTSLIMIHGDTIVVGKILGTTLLGVYNLSWQTSNLISRLIVNGGNKLFFPMLSSVSEDRERMVDILRRLLRILSSITFPALIGLFVVADEFILAIYGDKWIAAVIPLQILIIYAIRFSIGSPLWPVLKALGRPDLLFKLGICTLPFYLCSIVIGCNYGLVGVAAGVTLVRTAAGGVSFVLVARQLKVATASILVPVIPSFFAAVTMGLLLSVVKCTLAGLEGVIELSVLIAAGIIIYFLVIRYFFRGVARDYAEISTRLLGKWAIYIHRLLGVRG